MMCFKKVLNVLCEGGGRNFRRKKYFTKALFQPEGKSNGGKNIFFSRDVTLLVDDGTAFEQQSTLAMKYVSSAYLFESV